MLPEPAIARVPIVALTADVTDEAADKAQRSGINEIVVKPVSPDKLSELLRTYRT